MRGRHAVRTDGKFALLFEARPRIGAGLLKERSEALPGKIAMACT
jgi:hypothetical protein